MAKRPRKRDLGDRCWGREALGDCAKPITARALADSLDSARPIELGQEGPERVTATDLEAFFAKKVKPLAIVNLSVVSAFFAQQPNGHALQALATKAMVEIVNAELGSLSEDSL